MPALPVDETDDKQIVDNEENWYDSVEEATMRLQSSVVLYDGRPVYVTRCLQNKRDYGDKLIRVYFYELPLLRGGEQKEYRKVINSPKFNFKPFKMGLYEGFDGLFNLSRVPVRRYQQGLTENNLSIHRLTRQATPVGFNGLLQSSQFVDLICGKKYPSIAETKVAADPWNGTFRAISRTFGVISEDNGSYSLISSTVGGVVGRISEDNKAVFNPKFEYLRELFAAEVKNG